MSLGQCSLGQSALGQKSTWTIFTWTKIATPFILSIIENLSNSIYSENDVALTIFSSTKQQHSSYILPSWQALELF